MALLIPATPVYITGPEVYLPDSVGNKELLQRFGYTDGLKTRESWIEARSGIQSRPWAKPEQACSDLAIEAGKKLLRKINSRRDFIEQLVVATVSGDFYSPPVSPLVQVGLGLSSKVGCYDLAAACAGFSTALLATASQVIATGADQMLICSEIRSKFLNPKDLSTAILFGDGAAAVHLSAKALGASFLLRGVSTRANGEFHSLIQIPAGGSRRPASEEKNAEQFYIKMEQGAAVFLSAMQAMKDIGLELLQALKLSAQEVNWLVPHQANGLLIQQVGKEMQIPPEKTVNVISHLGNISGASSPIALWRWQEQGHFKKGDLILNVSAGGGGFAAAALLEVL